jgi:hypothetical protein
LVLCSISLVASLVSKDWPWVLVNVGLGAMVLSDRTLVFWAGFLVVWGGIWWNRKRRLATSTIM